MFINVRPFDRKAVFESEHDAIQHVIVHGIWAKNWNQGGKPFGQTVSLIRAVDGAIKKKDYSAFTAKRRRGYWRVELAA